MAEVDVLEATALNHDVYRFRTTKPDGFDFRPGQATELALDREGWREEKRPFTFTSLPGADHLEFTIKTYPSHDGVTEQLRDVKPADRFLIGEPWGAIEYKGPGVFIAGGAGLTPFLAILKHREAEQDFARNTLFFANKTEKDIFCDRELAAIPGLTVHHVISDEETKRYMNGRIDKDFLSKNVEDFDQKFYVCGPPQMVEDISEALEDLGADADGIVFED